MFLFWLRRLLFLLIIMPQIVTGACTVTDDAGHTLQLNQSASRIVVLAPDLVENIFAIGAGNRIVGVVSGSDYPEAAKRISSVGSYMGIDLERIVALKPDLIVTWKYAFPRQLAALRQFGIPVYVAAPKALEDISRTMNQLGCLTDQAKPAAAVAIQFEQGLNQLRTQPATSVPKVFFLIDNYALMTMNKDSWINQVIELCGGKNIFADAKIITPEVSREAVLLANPDIIINISINDDWQASWRPWPQIAAVKNRRLYTIQPDLISRAGPRLVRGARKICQFVHGAIK